MGGNEGPVLNFVHRRPYRSKLTDFFGHLNFYIPGQNGAAAAAT